MHSHLNVTEHPVVTALTSSKGMNFGLNIFGNDCVTSSLLFYILTFLCDPAHVGLVFGYRELYQTFK